MAEDNPDFFQTLFKGLLELLQPVLSVFSDNEAKTELLESLGLESSVNTGTLPTGTALEQYIQAEADDVDAIMLLSAMADLTQLMLAIEGLVRAAIQAGDGDEQALDEMLNSLMSALLMSFVHRKSPGFYAFARLITTLTAQTTAQGGIINFFDEVIIEFFRRLGQGLETEEGASAVSESVFMGFAALMVAIQKFLLDNNNIDTLALEMAYGYEGITPAEGAPVILADKISNRNLSYKVGITPFDDPDNQITFYNTFAFIPEAHGGAAFITDLAGVASYTIPVTENISLTFGISGEGVFRIGTSPSASAGKNNKISLTFEHDRKDKALLKIFPEPEIKIGLKKYSIGISAMPDDFEIKFRSKLPIKVLRGEDASFPLSLLPEKIEEDIPLDFGYSLKKDFFFGNGGGNAGAATDESTALATEGGGAESDPDVVAQIIAKILNLIDLRIPINEDIGGIVGIQILNLKTSTSGGLDTIKLETSLDFWLKFGSALTLSISRLGAEMQMQKRDDSGGVLGYDITPKFKPPNGAGVRVNAEVIKGGGFLYLDDEKGEYFGSLELEFKNLFTLKAVGIINTIMPDGSDGFSMLILITAEFSPIQLGFGFTLNGVGGLLGIDRKTNIEALRIGIRTNAIKSILFPEDVIGNISRIINDIRTIFPVQKDVFLIGLMAKLGWGATSLITIELGLIVEVPDPKIMLLGVIKARLPDENAAVLKLQVNFLGVIDFENEFIYFEAHLFESKLVGITLTGSLAFVVSWGDEGVFGISVGGFHPDFRDYPVVPTLPGAFRDMARIGLSLLSGDNPSLTIECYLAITSNSVQFGAKLELLASGPMSFNLYGMLAFDAIFIFDPFSFSINLEATLAIRRKRSILFGIEFNGRLSGPTPWNIAGSVSFGVVFFDVTISFNETWGDPLEVIPAATADLRSMLVEEIDDLRNWRSVMSRALHNSITLKERDAEDNTLIIDPFGELQFSQRTLPLNYEIEKYGNKQPLNDKKFAITEVKLNQQIQNTRSLKEFFAPGHYKKLSESEKLSRKSFEKITSGFALEGSAKLQTAVPHLPPVALNYEINYTEDDAPEPRITLIPLDLFKRNIRLAAVAKSPLSWTRLNLSTLNATEEIEIADTGYAIANVSDLKALSPELKAANRSEIKAMFNDLIAENPALQDEIQIVETYELAS